MDYEYICTGCLGNQSLIKYVKKNKDKTLRKCPICGSENKPAIKIYKLAYYMNDCISDNYSDLDDRDGIDFSPETGNYYYIDTNMDVECTNVYTICEDNDVLSGLIDDREELYRYIFEQVYPKRSISADLAETGWSHIEVYDLEFNWDRFNYLVQNNNRFFDCGHHSREEYLERIFGLLSEFEETIQVGTELFRVRNINNLDDSFWGSDDTTLKEIAPPPCKYTKSYRMSPQGISYTYLSTDIITCLKECNSKIHDRVLIGKFRVKRDLKILNLEIKELEMYDLFSGKMNREKENLEVFIERYCKEISKPVKNNNDFDYLATQIIAEYIRFRGYDGMAYSSAKTKATNYVLFYGPDYYKFPDTKPNGWSIYAETVQRFTNVLELKGAALCEVLNTRSCRYNVSEVRGDFI